MGWFREWVLIYLQQRLLSQLSKKRYNWINKLYQTNNERSRTFNSSQSLTWFMTHTTTVSPTSKIASIVYSQTSIFCCVCFDSRTGYCMINHMTSWYVFNDRTHRDSELLFSQSVVYKQSRLNKAVWILFMSSTFCTILYEKTLWVAVWALQFQHTLQSHVYEIAVVSTALLWCLFEHQSYSTLCKMNIRVKSSQKCYSS